MSEHSLLLEKASTNAFVFSAASTPQTRRDRAWLDQMLRKQTPHYEEVTVTPSLAEMMLACNRGNRPIAARHVEEYARLIKAGLFMNSPQPLAFDRNGRLLDGQHRLAAIAQTGTAVKLRVFFGEDPAVFEVLDTGKKRTPGDFLGAQGVCNATKVAATLRYDASINDGQRGLGRRNLLSNSEMIDAISRPEFEHLQLAIGLTGKIDKSLGKGATANSGISTGLLRTLRVNDPNTVTRFADAVASGLNLTSTSDPIHRLRQRLLSGVKNPVEVAALIVKAWNAYTSGRNIGSLAWYDREAFPEPARMAR